MLSDYLSSSIRIKNAYGYVARNALKYWLFFIIVAFIQGVLSGFTYKYISPDPLLIYYISTLFLTIYIVGWCCVMKPTILPKNSFYFAQITFQCFFLIATHCLIMILHYYFFCLKFFSKFFFCAGLFVVILSTPFVLRVLETRSQIYSLISLFIDSKLLKKCISPTNIFLTLAFSLILGCTYYSTHTFFENKILICIAISCSYMFIAHLISSIHIIAYIINKS